MFQTRLEKIALGIFATTVTLLIATIALARPAILMPDGDECIEPPAPVRLKMTCVEMKGAQPKTFGATFVVELTPESQPVSEFVTTPKIGSCFADSTDINSSYGVLAGSVDTHSFKAGGNTCKGEEGSVSFTVVHDRGKGLGRQATLVVKGVASRCRLICLGHESRHLLANA